MTFFREMVDVQAEFVRRDVHAITPENDDFWPSPATPSLEVALKRKASLAHIRKIRDPKTFGILVLNYDKYGVRSYIGANSFAEIAVAVVAKKRVYLANGIPDAYNDELVAWGVIPLRGSLDALVHEYNEKCRQEARQMELF